VEIYYNTPYKGIKMKSKETILILSEIANTLDKKSLFKEASNITNIMNRIVVSGDAAGDSRVDEYKPETPTSTVETKPTADQEKQYQIANGVRNSANRAVRDSLAIIKDFKDKANALGLDGSNVKEVKDLDVMIKKTLTNQKDFDTSITKPK